MIGEDMQKFSESRVMRTIAIGRVPIRNLPKRVRTVLQYDKIEVTRTLKTSLKSVMVSLLGQCIANVPAGPESAFHFGDSLPIC
ncbi:hypothetical protein AVEN_16383-1 [Araneus ventricosus]|uniref:Uncharacterized protein n=1 Tax=Araneus ventricosus TaxID=182803 RepID=A0A4Y2V1N2_ARAVE|nr:hypothetical protein AVEN_16383-1 [Araneus ventricosus]